VTRVLSDVSIFEVALHDPGDVEDLCNIELSGTDDEGLPVPVLDIHNEPFEVFSSALDVADRHRFTTHVIEHSV